MDQSFRLSALVALRPGSVTALLAATLSVSSLFGAGCTDTGASLKEGEEGVGETQQNLVTCVTIQRGTAGSVADTSLASNVSAPGWMSNATTIRAGGPYEGLLRFDVSAVPAGSVVTSANLSLTTTATVSNSPLYARAALAAWTEPTSSYPSFNQQVRSTTMGTVTPSSANAVVTMALDNPTVQSWVDGTLANNGLLLETAISSGPTARKETIFASSESPTVAARPALEVCYTAPDPCAAAPCQNYGVCSTAGSGYTCACVDGYTGTDCEVAPANICPDSLSADPWTWFDSAPYFATLDAFHTIHMVATFRNDTGYPITFKASDKPQVWINPYCYGCALFLPKATYNHKPLGDVAAGETFYYDVDFDVTGVPATGHAISFRVVNQGSTWFVDSAGVVSSSFTCTP